MTTPVSQASLTPNTSPANYCPPLNFLQRYDGRTVADLISDTGIRAGGSPNPDPAVLAVNANLLAALMDASGDVEAACLKGNRYQAADLLALVYTLPVAFPAPTAATAPATAAQGRLFRLVSRLALCYLYERRPDKGPIPETYQAAWDHLDALAEGAQIFGFVEVQAAGLIVTEVETPTIVEHRNLSSFEARNYYGRRLNRIVPPS